MRVADKLAGDSPYLAALRALSIDLARLVHEIPHVTIEPLRPRKEEQLGGGYHLSAFAERTTIEHADAVIAVSEHVKRDVLQVYPAPARAAAMGKAGRLRAINHFSWEVIGAETVRLYRSL